MLFPARAAPDEPLLTPETLDHITGLVAQHGSDCWWTLSTEELLPPALRHLAPKLRKVRAPWHSKAKAWSVWSVPLPLGPACDVNLLRTWSNRPS